MSNDMMALYWELASVDPTVRQKAADKLVRALYTFQHDLHPTLENAVSTPSGDNLDQLCAQDVSYGIKRLLRGLPSSRDGARQGFAVALTELLKSLEFLRVSTALSLLAKLTQTEGAKGQEERDILFGRIFGLMAICQADMLARPHTTIEDVQEMVTRLLKYASSKSYIKETCFKVLITMVEKLHETKLEAEAVEYVIPTVLSKGIEGPEELWFAIVMQSRYPKFAWASVLPSWRDGSVLHTKNKTQLVAILKESTYTIPRVHLVWDALLDAVLTSPPLSKLSIRDLWSVLDDALFSSSYERKFLGLLLFQKILPRLDATEVPFLFTPQLLRTLINNLAKHDNYLHKVAKQTASMLSTVALERKDVALQLVLQLVGKNGHQRFDQVTKTKTVENILGSLEGEGIETYIKYLQDMFVNQGEPGDAGEADTVNQRRQWAVDQMLLLLKNGKIPKEEKWIQRIARFVWLHAFFKVQKADPKVDVIQVPRPEVSDATRELCTERLGSLLATLAGIALKSTGETRLAPGTMTDGQYWANDLHTFTVDLSKNKRVSLLVELDQEAQQTVQNATSTLHSIQKRITKPEVSQNRDVLAQYKAFELLFLHLLLHVYIEPAEAVGVLDELKNCFDLFFQDKSASPKKRKAKDADDMEEDHAPIEVLVDILISFLAKPSALVRSLSQDVFKVFNNQLTKKSLDLIFEVLSAKGGVAGAQELFEEEEEEDEDVDMESGDAMDVDSKQEDDDDEDDEEEGEDEDEDEDDDDEEESGEVDEELRRKIKEALGNAAIDEEDDDSDEEAFLDDDEMEAFDDKLAEIFRQRKEIKTAKKDVKNQVLHFKLRVVDLLDIFLRKSPQNPLVIELIMPLIKLITSTSRSTDDKDLHEKLLSLAKNKLFRLREVPTEPALNVDRAVEVLKEVHEYARRATDATLFGLCNGASLLLTRILSHVKEPIPKKEVKKTPKKRKVETKEAPDTKPMSRVASVYQETLSDFMTKNKTRVKPVIFLDLINRYPVYAWELLPSLVDFTSESVDAKAYNLVQAYNIISRIMKQAPKGEDEERAKVVKEVLPKLAENFIRTLQQAVDGEVDGPRSLGKERVKDLLKDMMAVARRSVKLIDDQDEISKLWRADEIRQALDRLCDSERFQGVTSLKGQSKQLLALVEKKA
ncbi:DNA-directed DNA polymerase [Spizellomyces punctatus DAOM BR117]|uniref:DNA polymerase phi subunit n=1 Tax=Spizellomyces punctatus (strain DAOM BR117) TaxID=645134 RepID=A0A0L0HLD5_SPIPD|nr:DNA-directed DNA polymerase [Spizellomyces punctatus DAOM BR117]KND01937.1 hypothetical protein SPPG_02445 [Spizellomyces punctatus DAOM BR117]|eukprot:XP_016609976.1 hypothetical protein SPPG_02445 [Spizellomyces punctatus DAOM BR117]